MTARREDDLGSAIKRLGDSVDTTGSEERVLSSLRSRSPGRTYPYRGFLIAAGVGAAATVAAVSVLNGAGALGGVEPSHTKAEASSPASTSLQDGPAGLVGPGEPCLDAVFLPAEVTAIKAQVRVPVWAPSPRDAKLTRAWACGGETPVLMYGDLQVSYEAGWAGVDILKKWADLAADEGGAIEEIQGYQALVQEASTKDGSQQVMLVHGDTLVRILAASDVPIGDLVELAKTLQLPARS